MFQHFHLKNVAIGRYRTSQKCSIKCHTNDELLQIRLGYHIIYFAATCQEVEFHETSSLDSQLRAKFPKMMVFGKNRLQINRHLTVLEASQVQVIMGPRSKFRDSTSMI